MALNREKGEPLEGYDSVFRVVPAEKYQALPRLTTMVPRTVGIKFKRKVMVAVPIAEAAYAFAQAGFINVGAPRNVDLEYDVMVQEYPRTNQVVFIFCATIKGQDQYVIAPFQLTNQQVAELVITSNWKSTGMPVATEAIQ